MCQPIGWWVLGVLFGRLGLGSNLEAKSDTGISNKKEAIAIRLEAIASSNKKLLSSN